MEPDNYTYVNFDSNRILDVDPDAILIWFHEMGIPDDEWEFHSNNTTMRSTLIFSHEADAIAFRMRFGL